MTLYDVLGTKKEYLKNKKAMIFDFDGTLVDSMCFWRNRRGDDVSQYGTFADYLAVKYSAEVEPKPYAVELLKLLKENGVPACIATETPRFLSKGFFDKHYFDGLTEFYVDCGEIGKSKRESPAVFVEAAKRLGLPAEECVVVEDSLYSAISAKKGGFACIGVYEEENRDHMFELKNICDDYIYNLGKLLPGTGFSF